ncbi:MAG: MFS transporter [Rhodobacteraceae bacterium]|nr:MFS transporter [Paracoccaceae bacterium]
MPKFPVLFVLSLSASLLMLGVGMIVALLPQRVHAMTGTLESVGLVASVFALAYLLAQVPVGLLADRWGPKGLLVTGYLLCAASGLAFLAAGTVGGLYLGRVLQGLGEAPVWALGPALLSLAYPAARGRAIGLYNAAIHAGLTAGPLLGLALAPDGAGRAPFVVFTLLCLTAALIVLAFLRPVAPTGAPREGPSSGGVGAILRQRSAVALLGGVLLYGAGYGVFLTVLPVSLAATHGFGATAASLLFVLFYAAVSLSQVLAGALSDRVGRHGFLIGGMALAALGLGALPLVPGLWALLPLGMASLGLGSFGVASMAELSGRLPEARRGAAAGAYYLFWGAGYVLGPLATGALAGSAPGAAFGALALLFGLSALLLQQSRRA